MIPHDAEILELDPDKLRGYPPDVRYQTWCTTCGGGFGPLTLREAKAWKIGHDLAVSRADRLDQSPGDRHDRRARSPTRTGAAARRPARPAAPPRRSGVCLTHTDSPAHTSPPGRAGQQENHEKRSQTCHWDARATTARTAGSS